MTYQEQLLQQQKEYSKKLSNLFSTQPISPKDSVSLQSLSKQKRKYLKNVTLQSYLQSKKLQKMFSPFSDTDKDNFINIFDCYPFDSSRHGVGEWIRRGIEKIKRIVKKPKPTPKAKELPKAPESFLRKVETPEQTARRKEVERVFKLRPSPPSKPSPKVTRRGGGGGISRISPTTGKPEYVLPSGEVVPATEETKEAIIKGAKTKAEVKKLTEAQKLAPKVKAEVKTEVPTGVISVYTGEPIKEVKLTTIEKLQLWGKKFKEQPVGTFKKAGKKVLEGVGSAITFIPGIVSEIEREAAIEEFKRGRWKVKQPPGIVTGKGTVIVEKVTPYTEEEIAKELPFLPIEEIQKRRQRRLQFEAEKIYKKKAQEILVKYENKIKEAQKKAQEKINKGKNYNEVYNEYQKKIEKLNKQYQKEVEEKAKPEISKVMKKEEKYLTKLAKKQALYRAISLSPIYTGTGFALGLAGGAVPAVGYGLAGYGAISTAVSLPEITAPILEKDISTLKTMGVQVGSFMVGAGIGGYIGAKIRGKFVEAPKITRAINRAKVKIDFKQLKTSKQIKGLRISPEGQKYLENYLDKGFIVRLGKAKLTSTDVKYLPEVKSEFVEILTRDGKIVDRISLGKFIGKYKGKVFSRDVISHATGKLDEATGKYFTRVFISKAGKKFKPIEYYEFLEQVRATELLKKGKYRAVKGEVEIELLKKVEKPKPEDITKILRLGRPTEKQIKEMLKDLKGKPYGKAEVIYGGEELIKKIKLLYGKGDISTKWQELIGGKYTAEYGYGRGIFERIFGKIKVKKPTKLFDLSKVKSKPSKLKLPKVKFRNGQELIYVREFPYQTPPALYEAITYEQAYISVPKLVQPSLGGVALQSFLLGRLTLRTKQRQLQINLQKLSQKLTLAPKKLKTFPEITKRIQPQFQAQLQRQYLKQITQLGAQFTYTPTTPPTPEVKVFPEVTISPFIFDFKIRGRKKRRQPQKKIKLFKQLKAYQASVGAAILGLTISKEEAKKLSKRLTGLELRPIIKSNKRKKMEVQILREQQANLIEPAIATARKGSPRKAVRNLNRQYSENLKKMLSYAKIDKERTEARKKLIKYETGIHNIFSLSTLKVKKVKRLPKTKTTYNVIRQGERKNAMLRRLQNVFGFGLIKKKQKRKRR